MQQRERRRYSRWCLYSSHLPWSQGPKPFWSQFLRPSSPGVTHSAVTGRGVIPSAVIGRGVIASAVLWSETGVYAVPYDSHPNTLPRFASLVFNLTLVVTF